MKLNLGVWTIVISLFLCNGAYAQNFPTYSIPSFNVQVDSTTNFVEGDGPSKSNQAKERRQVNVVIKSETQQGGVKAAVYVYRIDRTKCYGPFEILPDVPLLVVIDEEEWGVVIDSGYKVAADVWISGCEKGHNPIIDNR